MPSSQLSGKKQFIYSFQAKNKTCAVYILRSVGCVCDRGLGRGIFEFISAIIF